AVNSAEVNRTGLTPEAVTAAVSGALLGVMAGEVRLEDRSVAVRVRAPDSVRYDPGRLGSLPVMLPGGRGAAPLATLADFERGETRSELIRENQQQMIAVTADLGDRALG